jgi:hypothetical protein
MRSAVTAELWDECRRGLVAEMVELGLERETAEAEAEVRVERIRMRIEWARERFNAFLEMQDKAGEAYVRQIEAHPDVDWEAEDAPVLPEPPEEAVAQAIYAEVMAAVNHDRWPRHLHFRDV